MATYLIEAVMQTVGYFLVVADCPEEAYRKAAMNAAPIPEDIHRGSIGNRKKDIECVTSYPVMATLQGSPQELADYEEAVARGLSDDDIPEGIRNPAKPETGA